jgi:hypothetical protein
VRIDPLLSVSEQDLKAQFEMASTLTTMRGEANRLLRALDAVGAQMKERRGTAKSLGIVLGEQAEGVWQASEKEWREVLDLLAQPEGEPRWSQGPRVSERLDGLFGGVDAAFAAPTAYQQAYFEELKTEAQAAFARAGRFLDEGVPKLNEALSQRGVPTLARPAR